MWWTTGVGYDTDKIKDTLDEQQGPLGRALSKHIAMLDDWQEVFGLALIQLGLDANTTNTAEHGPGPRAARAAEAARPRLQHRHDHDHDAAATTGSATSGAPTSTRSRKRTRTIVYYIPEEGGVRGSDTMAIFSGAKHPIAAHLFLDFMLDAQISAENTNFIYYMGPNAAAKEYIDPAILGDPSVNPDATIVAKLQELLDLGPAVRDEYLKRWQTLRGG